MCETAGSRDSPGSEVVDGSRLGQQAVGLLESAGVRCSRADCARDVRAGEDEPVGALALQLRQAAPSRAAQHPLQVPHCQAFSGLRVDRRLALHAGPCRLRELRDEAVRALVALGKRADD